MPRQTAPEVAHQCEKRNIEDLRTQIRAAEIITALEDHVMHNTDMTGTQISAALALLKKTLPDLPTSRTEEEPYLSHEDALDLLG